MPIYTSSKGVEKDTADMPYTYLANALKKAQEEGNQANIDALEAEISVRDAAAEIADNEIQEN